MEEIYIKYSRYIYNYLYKLTNNCEISEELTQETFYSAIKKINSLKKEESLSTWLCEIAKNKWRDFLKKNKKYEFVQFDNLIETLLVESDLEEDIISKECILNLYKKIHILDINTREVIYLKIKSDFTFKEIGEILGKSEQWARTTFYRGKIRLKEEFKSEK
jgi:RNA polymerase sigma-70 factor (ECF subfamily)